MASAMIGNLSVMLTMSTAAFQKGATLAEKRVDQMRGKFVAATASLKGLAAGLGVGLGADALYRVAAGAFEMASGLSEAAEKAGVSVEALQELQFAAKQTGVSNETLESTMRKLNNSLGQLQLGSKSVTEAFAQIGLSAEDLAGKDFQSQLGIIADALNKLPDVQQRIAVGQKLMGKSFSELLPLINGGSEALASYSAQAQQAGIITAEEAATLDKAADDWEAFKGRVLVATAQLFAAALQLGDAMDAWTSKTHFQLVALKESFVQFADGALLAVGKMVGGIRDWITGTLSAVWDGAIAKIKQVESTFAWLYDKVIGHSWIPDLVSGATDEFKKLNASLVQPAEEASIRVSQTFKQMADATLSAFSNLANSIKSGGFLSILEAVIGLGLQLGSLGVFGKGIQTNINGASSGTSGYLTPSKNGSGATIQVVPSPYFDVAVTQGAGRVVAASAPGIANAGAMGGVQRMAYSNSRSLG